MQTYIAKTPIKIMVDLESKKTQIIQEGETLELDDADAADLLASGSISGPVDLAKAKK